MQKNFPTREEIKSGSVLLIDKPLEWTSFDALNKIRKQIHTKIGHCGTLDPLATGLLICCTGKMTKQITQFQKQPKEYTGIFQIGASTPTYDLESQPENFRNYDHVTEHLIEEAVKEKFTGEIQQMPPAFSAIKLQGKKAYELARAGKKVDIKPRTITISEFQITKTALPEIHFRIACSTGTYIRSIAHDLGIALNCGAYLKALRRTKIGDYHVDDAPTIKEWMDFFRWKDSEHASESNS